MSKHIHDEDQRRKPLNVRVNESDLNEFDEWVNAHDEYTSRAEAVRSIMREAVGEPATDGGEHLPDDDQLADAYRWMLDRSYQYGGTPAVDVRDIRSDMANQFDCSKETLKTRIFAPLRRKGYLKPSAGRLYLKPRDAPPEGSA